MIKSIGGVALPASKNSTAERVPEVYRTRALSGRMITRYGYDKWKLTYQLPDESAMTTEYRARVYAVVMGALATAVPVVFLNPYTGEEETVNCKCTEFGALAPWALDNNVPLGYVGHSFTFEEV